MIIQFLNFKSRVGPTDDMTLMSYFNVNESWSIVSYVYLKKTKIIFR